MVRRLNINGNNIKVRSYQTTGAGMDWHVDDVLYEPPQLEVVWTMENTSDCQTMWKERNGSIETVETDVNSAILLRAGGVPHAVSSLKRGKRTIVKCVYAANDATLLGDNLVDQFGAAPPSKKRTNKRRKGRKQKRQS